MIASENFVPQAVLEAVGSVLTNKYAEGYPGRRYYGGCEEVDVAEQLAIDRAKELFGAEHANVQAHAGAQANNAAYMALIEPGDTIMGMALDHGGHLTHGMKLNVSGKLYEVVAYHVGRDDLSVDMDEVEQLAEEHRPKVIVAGWSAYPRHLDFAAFREIADGGRRQADGRHGPFRRAGRRRRAPEPGPARRRRHDDDPQDALRPAQRDDPLPRGTRRGDRQGDLPRTAGRAADAHHRRQGGGNADRRDRALPGPPAADDRQRAGACGRASGGRLSEQDQRRGTRASAGPHGPIPVPVGVGAADQGAPTGGGRRTTSSAGSRRGGSGLSRRSGEIRSG